MSFLNGVVGGKRLLEKQPVQVTTLANLPEDIICHIFSEFLTFRDLLNFETVVNTSNKLFCITTESWIVYKQKYNLDYTWAYTDNPKLGFRLGNALFRYLFLMHNHFNTHLPNHTERVREKFLDVAEKFPILSALLWADPCIRHTPGNLSSALDVDQIDEYTNMCAKGSTGEMLLQAVFEACVNKGKAEVIENLLMQTIGENTTLGCCYGWLLGLPSEAQQRLAIRAAHYGDESEMKRKLDSKDNIEVKRKYAQDIYNTGYRSILICRYVATRAFMLGNYEKAELHYDEVLKMDPTIDTNLASQLSIVKKNVGKVEEAEQYHAITMGLLKTRITFNAI